MVVIAILLAFVEARIRPGIDEIHPRADDQPPFGSDPISVFPEEATIHDVRLRPDVEEARGAGRHATATDERHVIGALAFDSIHVPPDGQPPAEPRQNVGLRSSAERPRVERKHDARDRMSAGRVAALPAGHVIVVTAGRMAPVSAAHMAPRRLRRRMPPGPQTARFVFVLHAVVHVVVVAGELQALDGRERVGDGVRHRAQIGVVFFQVQRQGGEPRVAIRLATEREMESVLPVRLPEHRARDRLALESRLDPFAVACIVILIIAVARGQPEGHARPAGTDRRLAGIAVEVADVHAAQAAACIPLGRQLGLLGHQIDRPADAAGAARHRIRPLDDLDGFQFGGFEQRGRRVHAERPGAPDLRAVRHDAHTVFAQPAHDRVEIHPAGAFAGHARHRGLQHLGHVFRLTFAHLIRGDDRAGRAADRRNPVGRNHHLFECDRFARPVRCRFSNGTGRFIRSVLGVRHTRISRSVPKRQAENEQTPHPPCPVLPP